VPQHLYYAWLAYRLAQKTGRTDVCALPSGISVPHMFVVTFVVMLPIKLKTNDPMKAWEAGLTWVFVQSFVLMAGGFIAPVSSARSRRAPPCSARSPASRSPSSRCARRCRCS
jgi:AGZA family xanthine/uracil permease-like MFS transporter